MCKTFSAIYTQQRELVFQPAYTDSHKDLIASRGFSDNGRGAFVRLEYYPVNGNFADLNTYELSVDERAIPEWFTTAERSHVEHTLRDRIRAMFVDTKRPCLLGGCWILNDGANVERCVGGRITCMFGSSQVGEMRDSSRAGKKRARK